MSMVLPYAPAGTSIRGGGWWRLSPRPSRVRAVRVKTEGSRMLPILQYLGVHGGLWWFRQPKLQNINRYAHWAQHGRSTPTPQSTDSRRDCGALHSRSKGSMCCFKKTFSGAARPSIPATNPGREMENNATLGRKRLRHGGKRLLHAVPPLQGPGARFSRCHVARDNDSTFWSARFVRGRGHILRVENCSNNERGTYVKVSRGNASPLSSAVPDYQKLQRWHSYLIPWPFKTG
jgi:hypothetical protein